MNRDYFEKTIWFRLLKILFSLILVSGLVITTLIAWEKKPIGQKYFEIQCNNGKVFRETNLSPSFRLIGEWADHGNILCAGDSLSQAAGDRLLSNKPEGGRLTDWLSPVYGYSSLLKYEPVSTKEYAFWIIKWLLGVIILTLISWFVIRLFNYIAFGLAIFRKPKRLFD